MQSDYPGRFEREMGCTEAEWLRWLGPAIGECEWLREAGGARVRIASGTLHLSWREASPRRIALLELARLHVVFVFENVGDEVRHAFMRRFDLYMHRGGG